MNNCYKIKLINQNSNSVLDIDKCYILTMEDSTRLQNNIRSNLKNLAKNTYVQYNKGYKN